MKVLGKYWEITESGMGNYQEIIGNVQGKYCASRGKVLKKKKLKYHESTGK